MSNFEIQWKALKEIKDEHDPEIPKITKVLPIIKWTEAFQDFLNRDIGDRMFPLAYEIRIDSQVPGNVPPLAVNQPHSTEHGSVEGELVARAALTYTEMTILWRITTWKQQPGVPPMQHQSSLFKEEKMEGEHGRL